MYNLSRSLGIITYSSGYQTNIPVYMAMLSVLVLVKHDSNLAFSKL